MARIGFCGYILGDKREFGTQNFIRDQASNAYALQTTIARTDNTNYPTGLPAYALKAFGYAPSNSNIQAAHVI